MKPTAALAATALAAAALAALALLPPWGEAIRAKAWHFLATRPDVVLSAHTQTYVAAIAGVLALEVVLLGWGASSLRRLLHPTQSTWGDLLLWGAKVLGVSGALATVFSLGLADLGLRLLGPLAPPGALAAGNPLLHTLWLLVALDFVRYVMHVCQHKAAFWWQAHKYHHSATEFNVITTARGHPTDHAIQLVFLAIPTALLGGTVEQVLLLSILLDMHAGLTHSMLPWSFGWAGRWILVSPVAHRIHHSDLPEHFDRNYGSVFIIWDRIFGTWYAGPLVNDHVDVAGNQYNRRGLVWDFLEVPRRVLAALRPARFARRAEDGAARQD